MRASPEGGHGSGTVAGFFLPFLFLLFFSSFPLFFYLPSFFLPFHRFHNTRGTTAYMHMPPRGRPAPRTMETAYIVHYVQEDQPYAIGRAIADWYRRIDR